MAASSKLMIGEAERRFPVRIRIGVPPEGFGARLDALKAWLDDNCGARGWAMTPSGLRGVLNDAVAVYFREATLAGAWRIIAALGFTPGIDSCTQCHAVIEPNDSALFNHPAGGVLWIIRPVGCARR